MTLNPPHDSDDPMSYVNGLEIAALKAQLSPCRHCHMTSKLLAMTDTGWGLELFHEPECPEHEDNKPAVEPTWRDDT